MAVVGLRRCGATPRSTEWGSDAKISKEPKSYGKRTKDSKSAKPVATTQDDTGSKQARVLPSSMPTRSGNRVGRARAFRRATYMQSALEGSWLMPNNLLKSRKLFSRPCLNSLPCGEGLGWAVSVGGHTACNNDDPPPRPSPNASRACPTCAGTSRDPGKPGARGEGADRVCRQNHFHSDKIPVDQNRRPACR
jgi:hypothetical protein